MRYKEVLTFFITLIILALPSLVLAQGFTDATPFAGTATGNLIDAITAIVNVILSIVSTIAVIVIIFGVVTAVGAGDDEDVAAQAKNNIIYALLGLIIVALSAVIVNFILSPL